MASELIYAFRVMRLPLLDAGGAEIGKIDDIVVVPGRPGQPPRVTGFVATSQRRRIFVNAARIAELMAQMAASFNSAPTVGPTVSVRRYSAISLPNAPRISLMAAC